MIPLIYHGHKMTMKMASSTHGIWSGYKVVACHLLGLNSYYCAVSLL
jgi:hypothetical protein